VAEVAEGFTRPAWAEIDLEALGHNVSLLRRLVAPATPWVVVKADAYGHGAVPIARAALSAGAGGLAVAIVEEGLQLRRAGISAPILVLSEPPPEAARAAVLGDLISTVYTDEGRAALSRAATACGRSHGVHVKVDTGMHRVGAEPARVPSLVAAVASSEGLRFEGLWTHLSVAEGCSPDERAFTASQLELFDGLSAQLEEMGLAPRLRHAANSAAAISWPRARYDLVRCGLAAYGELPSRSVEADLARALGPARLRPVLTLRARVTLVRVLEAGARPSYGRRRPLPQRSFVATVPIGYADGVPWRLFDAGGEVLIRGRRRPLAGSVTMDQLIVDCGPEGDVAPGDEVVLLGRQGSEEVTAAEWASKLGTISYEVLCGIGPRVPRFVRASSAAR